MPLEFSTQTIPAKVIKSLNAAFSLHANDSLKLEFGDDDFEATVPEGKVWKMNVVVTVNVDDA